jgi:hypothetical protein
MRNTIGAQQFQAHHLKLMLQLWNLQAHPNFGNCHYIAELGALTLELVHLQEWSPSFHHPPKLQEQTTICRSHGLIFRNVLDPSSVAIRLASWSHGGTMLTDIRMLRPLPEPTQRVRCGSEELVRLVVHGIVADTFLGGRGRYTFGDGLGIVVSVHRLSYCGHVRWSSCHMLWLKTDAPPLIEYMPWVCVCGALDECVCEWVCVCGSVGLCVCVLCEYVYVYVFVCVYV